MSQPSAPSETASSGPAVVWRLLGVVAAVLVALVLADLALRAVGRATGFVRTDVEIASPAALYAKIADLTEVEKPRRVALLGDSLVLGKAMRDAGVADWRAENLAARLRVANPALRVENLAMNGALPSDIEPVVRALVAAGVGAVVLDVNLRHFSSDFSGEAAQFSRIWLRDFALTPEGRIARSAASGWIDGPVEAVALNHWYTYRVRDVLRQSILGDDPYEAVVALRNRANAAFLPPPDLLDSDLRLILNARARYQSVAVAESQPQVASLLRMIRMLRDADVPAVVFYATERPDVVPDITEPALHKRRLETLAGLIQANGGPRLRYLGPRDDLVAGDFIDHVHVLPGGYAKYAASISQALGEVMPRP